MGMGKPAEQKHRVRSDVWPQLMRALEFDKAGKLGEADELYRAVLAIDPTNFAALNRRAVLSALRGELVEALRLIQAAAASNPNVGHIAVDMGNILARMGRIKEAMECYDRGAALQPDHWVALNGCGLGRTLNGRYEDAIVAFTRAIEANPAYPEAHFHLALALLLTGQFARGWEEYEWRWAIDHIKVARPLLPLPNWNGEPLVGKGIYLYIEQGYGDAIMFARYAPMVAARGGTVLFCVRPALKALLADLPGVQVGVEGDTGPRCDYMCALLSLPRIFKTDLASIPADVPYIRASPERLAKWEGRIPRDGRLNIGVAWAGNRDFAGDSQRSIGLAPMLPLLDDRRIRFVSLQRELRDDDAAEVAQHPEIVHFGSELGDFADTAALITQLDLVISVDSAVAHLAGAMARPVWILLPFNPDFRWLIGREDSPWYPTARLFRQPATGDWASVVARLRDALAGQAQSKSSD
ncbi:MAG TPA: tetratricopeptide repeat-containing glycosyltransferase family protein [Xanthobacteraceae bacterium]